MSRRFPSVFRPGLSISLKKQKTEFKMKTKLFLFAALFLLTPCLFAEETASAPVESGIQFTETSVTPAYLTEKADSDAVTVGVVEFVPGGEETAEEAPEVVVGDETEEKTFGSAALTGPAEVAASLAMPLALTGIGASLGVLPAAEGNLGMAVLPFTTTIGAGIGAVCSAVATPYLALKGIFDTLTFGAFVDEDFDLDNHTFILEDQVDNVNDVFTLNSPFDDEEEDESAEEEGSAEEETSEDEPEPEPETETESESEPEA